MLKIENSQVFGFEGAVRGMRNPLASWEKSDSHYCEEGYECLKDDHEHFCRYINDDCICKKTFDFHFGKNDLSLATRLVKAGDSDRKFLRMIHVQVDVTAPLYWWKEADTYKVATVTNSCSTMHTIHKRDLTLKDFSFDDADEFEGKEYYMAMVKELNNLRKMYVETKDKTYWRKLIQRLPSAFNQMRTWDLNYETLLSIYFQRRNHKLTEWHSLCEWILNLPYMRDFIETLEKKSSGGIVNLTGGIVNSVGGIVNLK